MTQLEIDVSGSDILSKDYTVVIAEKDNSKLLIGYKFNRKIQQDLLSKFGEKRFHYNKSKKGQAHFRIRLYCIIIYYLFKKIRKQFNSKEIFIDLCRDFQGNENNIGQQLDFFIRKKLKLNFTHRFTKLENNSIADKYAFLIRHDKLNKLQNICITLKTNDFEKFLK